VVSVVMEELERAHEQGVSEEEVEAARSYLLGREPFQRETARQWAVLELESTLWDLPVNDPDWFRKRLEAVRPEEVGEAARRYLVPGKLVRTAGIPI
jgi:predicted Zn-dependent peptidase